MFAFLFALHLAIIVGLSLWERIPKDALPSVVV